ncbi:SDR family oxidoreductase [Flavobacteriaceae bacterium F89]|uniref:SDR family oxidoreductase n=1 Tax=Cerina litoralis TaxID=2874477 RepID=A0AAE3EVI8_9FLAO|nr:SDR family oxidoreductase [Cerina litoralis]MCG2461305.1 SDR family oxidoreductase [Cerina litoralis]
MNATKNNSFSPEGELKGTKSVALILGGSSGLGLATANKLASEGFDIIVVHRDRRSDLSDIERSFEEIKAYKVKFINFNLDATNPEKRVEILEGIRKFLPFGKKLKVMVHSIAKGNLKPMFPVDKSSLGSSDFHLTLDAMAISLYDWARDLVEADLFADDARIVSFTSEGNTKALPNYGAVSAAKAALEAITRNMALEFAPLGIKANCIQAGVTDTASFKMIPDSDNIKKAALNRNPHGRLTTPEDVANAVYLLTTDEAKWITGTVIKVDGGESLR